MNDIKTTFHYDELEDKGTIAREQDCEPIVKEIEDIKQVFDGKGRSSLGYFVGRIPAIIVEQYLKEVGISFEVFCKDDTHIKRIMHNPDYKRFRVWEGRM